MPAVRPRGLVAFLLAIALLWTASGAAPAAPSPAPRAHIAKSRHHHNAYDIYKNYRRAGQKVPLRWGTLRFGYRHLRHRHDWGPALDAGIRVTLAHGAVVDTPGTSETYEYWLRDATGKFETNVGFRVVVQWAETRHDGKPKGIITAYEIARV
jgi:hypothetical protein